MGEEQTGAFVLLLIDLCRSRLSRLDLLLVQLYSFCWLYTRGEKYTIPILPAVCHLQLLRPRLLCLLSTYLHFSLPASIHPKTCNSVPMRPYLALLSCTLAIGALAQNNGATFVAAQSPSEASIAIAEITVTQTIEIADFPTGATSLIYDTSPVKPTSATPLAMPTSVFITALSNSTRPTAATALAGSGTNRTGTAKPSATTTSLASTIDGRMLRLWEGLLSIAVAVVVFC
jgi:hypothetical protein